MQYTITAVSDRRIWDDFWTVHGPGALFQSWDWSEVVKKQSIPLMRYAIWDGSRLVGIYQVVIIRARRGTYLHIRHGPVLCDHSLALWRTILAQLVTLAKSEGAWFLRFSPQIDDSPDKRNLFRSLGMHPSRTHEVDAERCMLLGLGQTEDAILAAMRKTTRYEIRRAEKQGINVLQSTDPRDLRHFFELYRATSKRQHFREHGGVAEEFEIFVKEGNAVLLLGYHEETLMSAAIILFSGNQAIYHHGASIPTKAPVNYAIQWEAIRIAKARGLRWYNFWGVAPEGSISHPWAGHSLFKRGFGGREAVTIHAQDYPVSPFYWLTRSIEWWQERSRGY